jgi:hypothetical protein
MAIGESNNPNFNVQSPTSNQALVYDSTQQAFVNANLQSGSGVTGAANVGTGGGIFKQLSGTDLQFRTIVAGNNITITENTDDVTISAIGSVSAGTNLGGGSGLFVDINSGNIRFKSVVAGSGITLTNSNTEVLVSVDSANVDAGTVGGLSSSVFLQKSDNLAAVADVSTARTNLGVYSKTEADAKYQPKAGDILPDADNTRSIGDNSNRYSDVYAVEFHGTATRAGVVTSIADHNIGELLNVDTTGVANGHVLKYNGSAWISTVDAGATNLGALSDVNSAGAANGQVLIYNSVSSQWEPGNMSGGGGGGGSSTLVGLTDTPTNYAGAAGYFVKVNSGASAVEFVADPGYITDLTSFSTTDVAEGTNQYFTNARADARIAAASINDLSDVDTSGVALNNTLKYNGSAWVVGTVSTDLSANTTTDLAEGTNLYYTTTRANTDFDTRLATKDTDALAEGSSNLYYTTARANTDIDARLTSTGVTGAKITNWDTAYSWGDHSTAGYLTDLTGSTLTSLSDVDAVAGAGDDGKILYYDHATTSFKWKTESGALTDTDGLPEGSSNLYYTDARADARITAAGITGAKITNWDTAYGWGDHSTAGYQTTASLNGDIDSHLNQSNPTSGYVLSWNGSDYAWVAQSGSYGDSDVASFLNGNLSGHIIPDTTETYDLGSTTHRFRDIYLAGSTINLGGTALSRNSSGKIEWDGNDLQDYNNLSNRPDLSGIPQPGSNQFLRKSSISVSTDPANGGGSLTYDNNGGFTFEPADLSGYQTTAGLNASIDSHLNQSNPTSGYVLSWNGSDYAWVAQSGSYGDSDVDAHLNQSNPTSGYVLSWNGSDYAWVAQSAGGGGTMSNLVEDTSPQLGGTLDANGNTIDMGTNVITDAKVGQWDTAYGWGDHSTAGYLTAETNDLSSAVTWANVPDTNITSSSVVQHQANLTITESQISDLGTYQTVAGLNAAVDSHLNQSNPTAGYVLSWNGSDYAWIDNTGYTSFNTDFDTRLATKSTTDLAEGTNLYYTDARADARVNLQTGANLDLSSKSTTDLSEGSNLYYTDTRVDSRITANWLIDEDNMASDSATKIPSQQSVKAYVDSQVATANELGEMTDVTLTSVANNDFLKYNSSTSQWENATVTASTAAGSDTYVQFNDGGVMGGDVGFTYNKTTDALSVGSVITAGASPSVSAAGNLTIETTASNGNIALTPNGSGDITLGANVTIDGSDNGYLKWTAPYATTGDLPNATTYHGMFAHVHGTGKGYFAHSGSWVELANHSQLANSSNWDTAYGWGDHGAAGYLTAETNDLSSAVTWVNVPDANITSSSVVQHQANLTITESQISDLQSYLTAETSHADVVVDGDFASQGIMLRGASAGSYSILTDNSANWNTAFGWGDHSTAGYQTAASLNSDIDSHLNQSNPTSGYVLSWNGSDYAWVAQSGGGGSSTLSGLTDVTITSASSGQVLKYNGSAWVNDTDAGGIALTDLSVTSNAAFGSGSFTYNNSTGVFTYTPPLLTGYLQDITSENLSDLADVDTTAPTDGQVLTWDNANSYWKPATVSGGGGSAGTEYEEFKINYATNGDISTISNTSSGISSVAIDSAAGGDLTVTFTGYTTPPLTLVMYGYQHTSNKYVYNSPATGSMTLRDVPGGGSSGSPTAFGSFSNIQIRCSEAETGAGRGFGTTTHAWVRFVMGA